jgi:hypothetical protein
VGDKSDQHVHIGAQAAQIVALRHNLAAEPIQGYVFGQFGHFVGSPYGTARIASQVEYAIRPEPSRSLRRA